MYRIPKVRCVSEDVVRYNYYRIWLFKMSRALFSDTEGGFRETGPISFVFLPEGYDDFSSFLGRCPGDICFAYYDKTKKVSTAKRYRFTVRKGGFLLVGTEATFFEEGQFEFLFKPGGEDSTYD